MLLHLAMFWIAICLKNTCNERYLCRMFHNKKGLNILFTKIQTMKTFKQPFLVCKLFLCNCEMHCIQTLPTVTQPCLYNNHATIWITAWPPLCVKYWSVYVDKTTNECLLLKQELSQQFCHIFGQNSAKLWLRTFAHTPRNHDENV